MWIRLEIRSVAITVCGFLFDLAASERFKIAYCHSSSGSYFDRMSLRRIRFLFGLGICILTAASSHAQVSKGHQILLNRGLQFQGLSQDDCYLHLDTYSNANYTSICWINAAGAHSS